MEMVAPKIMLAVVVSAIGVGVAVVLSGRAAVLPTLPTVSLTPSAPIVGGGLAAGVGLSLRSPPTALLWGLLGYVVLKIVQSTVWTLFGDPRG